MKTKLKKQQKAKNCCWRPCWRPTNSLHKVGCVDSNSTHWPCARPTVGYMRKLYINRIFNLQTNFDFNFL